MESRAAHRPKNYAPEAPGRVSLYTWGASLPRGRLYLIPKGNRKWRWGLEVVCAFPCLDEIGGEMGNSTSDFLIKECGGGDGAAGAPSWGARPHCGRKIEYKSGPAYLAGIRRNYSVISPMRMEITKRTNIEKPWGS